MDQMQEDFFGELRRMLSEMSEVSELHPVTDYAHAPALKFKFNGVCIDLVYAKLSLWVIPQVSHMFIIPHNQLGLVR